ncbi:hypothetical protein D1BOALGB6SA_10152 [Olavius sp. associated proteobacterium Delta 1]|nr:hypothetical protein D1BOALGB6SA_10152 [Olavius sp. associated proteobacterium Delta 1]
MSSFKIIVFILLSCIVATSSFADIYKWTDENGVKHYSNYAPAAKSKVLMKTKEEPYDEAADRARMETERQERLELARLELAQREAELELREAEAEQKLAAADRLAQEALREADYYLDEARTGSRIIYRGGGFWCRDHRYDCNYPIHHRWYYRKKHRRSSHYKVSRLNPNPRNRYVKKRHGLNKHDYGHKYRDKTRYRHTGNYASSNLNSRAATKFRGNRIGSPRTRLNGRANISWRSSGFARRH